MLLPCLCSAVLSASCPPAVLSCNPCQGMLVPYQRNYGREMLADPLIIGMPQVPRATDAFQRLVQAYQALLATTT